jgi:hypothetical protein
MSGERQPRRCTALDDQPCEGACSLDIPEGVSVTHYTDKIGGEVKAEVIAEYGAQEWVTHCGEGEVEEMLLAAESVVDALRRFERYRKRRAERAVRGEK